MRSLPLAVVGLFATTSLMAQSPLETTFVGGLVIANPPPVAATQLFDIDVLNPSGIVLTQIDINYAANSAPTGQFDVWMTQLGISHVGNQTNPAAWTLVSAQTPTVAGGRNAIVLNQPVALPPGIYGVALHSVGFNPIYTNPATPVPPLNPTYTNADLTIDMSSARARASDPIDPFGGATAGFSPRQANIALHYAVGTNSVDFTSDVTTGVSPLTVNFQGIGVSANPGGILSWQWDFDNNGSIDSTLQNPSNTFACGSYTVSLTIVDASGLLTETKVDYIVTDVVDADFSVAALAPNLLQFTDTSTPTPTSWSWDFDNDGTVDSTQQNPTLTSAAAFCSELDVVLSVSRACGPTDTLNRKTALAKSLITQFDGGTFTTATATGGINYFDLQVTNPQGISLCALHVHNQAATGNVLSFNLHLTAGTYVGNETSTDPWTLVTTATATAAGGGEQTFVPLAQSVYLPAGTYGVALEHVGHSPRYNNIGGPLTVSNADLVMTLGATQAEPVFSTGTLFTPRIANVGLYYTDCTFTNEPGYGWFGAGCPSSLGSVSANTAQALPRLGQTLNATLTNVPQGVAFMSVGLSRTFGPFGPLPFDLTALGGPGCFARVSPDSNTLLIGAPGSNLAFNLPVPNTPSLLCIQFYTQGLALDSVNALGAVSTDAAAAIVGL